MLFDSFATANEVARNRARMQSSAYKVSGTAEQIALKVVESYLDVLRLRENVRLTQENLQNHQKTYDQISLRATSGIGRQSDVDQAEAGWLWQNRIWFPRKPTCVMLKSITSVLPASILTN